MVIDDNAPGLQILWLLEIAKLPRLETLPKWILQAATASESLERIVIEACPNFRGQKFKSFQKKFTMKIKERFKQTYIFR